MWARVWSKLTFLFRRRRFDRELIEEFEFHREMLEHDKSRDGLGREAAARAARRQLGNLTAAREASRESWTFRWLDAVGSDLRLVIRALLRAKGFTAAAILTFALGIGANIAVFTALDRLMFRPLPFASADRLVQIHQYTFASSSPYAMLSAEIGGRVRERTQTLVQDLAYTKASAGDATIEGLGDAPVAMGSATANLLRVLGIRPLVGRDFTPDDVRSDAAPEEILLTYGAWRSRFGASESVVDRIVGVGRRRYRIVGVLAADFILPSSLLADRTDALRVQRNALAGPPRQGEITAAPIGRLRPRVTVAQAQAEISAIVAETQADAAGTGVRPTIVVQPLQQGLYFLHAKYLWVVVTAVALVLLVACVNLATLLLARGRSRERETAMRAALGASPARLITMAVLEAVVLCLVSGALALAACWGVQGTLVALVPPNFRGFAVAGPDLRLIGITFATALVSALLAGLIPAWAVRNTDVLTVLRRNDRGARARLRGGATLLVIEAAVGVVLVAGAAATVPSFARLVLKDPGFEAANLYTLDLAHGAEEDGPGPMRYPSRRVWDVLTIVRTQSGVMAAGALTQLPMGESATSGPFWKTKGIEGGQWGVSAGAFAALGTRVVAGRDFTDEEVDRRALVAILNESGAKRLWPGVSGDSPIGRTVTIGPNTYALVGIAADIQPAPGVFSSPVLFVPITADDAPVVQTGLVVAVRMVAGQEPNVTVLGTRLAARFDSRQIPLQRIADDLVEPRLQRPRFLAALFGALAAISVFLATVGIYAVVDGEMRRRRYEIAVRMALGASRREVRRLVFRCAVRPVAIGALVGIGIAWGVAGLIQALVFDVDVRAPWTLAVVALAIVAAGFVAGWRPARRAAAMDPAVVLRES